MTADEMRALARRCFTDPASTTTNEISQAGLAIIELLDRMKALEEEQTIEAVKADQQKALQELADYSQLVYNAWSR